MNTGNTRVFPQLFALAVDLSTPGAGVAEGHADRCSLRFRSHIVCPDTSESEFRIYPNLFTRPEASGAEIVSVVMVAQSIGSLGDAGRIYILTEDVKSAVRHLRTKANQVFLMEAYVNELCCLIIDMTAPFGCAPHFWSRDFMVRGL